MNKRDEVDPAADKREEPVEEILSSSVFIRKPSSKDLGVIDAAPYSHESGPTALIKFGTGRYHAHWNMYGGIS